jgi:3-hydroxyacyl-[acyl-carrier-protein] dehydratase
MTPEQVSETMRRCPPEAVQAACDFQTSRDPALVPVIVNGIIERFVEPERRAKAREGADATSLYEDLGVDSMLMVEIVMTIEQVLAVSAPDEELRNLRTLGDVKHYLDAKIRGLPVAPASWMDKTRIAAILPQGHPFLFLDSARLTPDGAEARYTIRGDEDALRGHFKDTPIFPASLMVEAAGQLASLCALANAPAGTKAWFYSADAIRCTHACKPGDQLAISARRLHARPPLCAYTCTIDTGTTRAITIGELVLYTGDLPAPPSTNTPDGTCAK